MPHIFGLYTASQVYAMHNVLPVTHVPYTGPVAVLTITKLLTKCGRPILSLKEFHFPMKNEKNPFHFEVPNTLVWE